MEFPPANAVGTKLFVGNLWAIGCGRQCAGRDVTVVNRSL